MFFLSNALSVVYYLDVVYCFLEICHECRLLQACRLLESREYLRKVGQCVWRDQKVDHGHPGGDIYGVDVIAEDEGGTEATLRGRGGGETQGGIARRAPARNASHRPFGHPGTAGYN